MQVGERRSVWAVAFSVVGLLAGLPVNASGAGSIGAGKAPETQRTVAQADSRKHVEEIARRIFAITDLVLDHHIEPATRQEMILAGIRSACGAKKISIPDLGRRVSDVRTLEELTGLLQDVWPKITRHGDAANAQIEEALFEGVLRPVPGAPSIVAAKEARVRAQIQANRYIGIGIALSIDEKSQLPQIRHALPGGTAALGGVKDGDLIEQINGKSVAPGSKLDKIINQLRGPEGSELTIRVRQPAAKQSRTLVLVRLPVMFRSVKNTPAGDGDERVVLVSEKPAIAYLKIDSISASTARELAAWEPRLRQAGAKGLILDLRGVGGHESFDGYHAAVLLADSLLDGKPLGKLQTRERIREFTADRECLFRDLPLAILINKHTDGPAAWVAAALQDADPPGRDRRRAVIVGTPGGGDNFVRSAYPLPDGDELILPMGLWQRPRADKHIKWTIRLLAFVGDPAVPENWSVTGAQATDRPDGIVPDAIFTQDEKPAALEALQVNATGQQQLSQAYAGGAASNRTAKSKDADPRLCEQAAVRELKRQIELAAKTS